jgi:phosphoserine phosphatase
MRQKTETYRRLLGRIVMVRKRSAELLEVADPKMYDEFIVYGDSRGDYALGQIATRFITAI